MHSRFFYWPVSFIPGLIVLFSWIVFNALNEGVATDFFFFLFFLLFTGYFIYFNTPILWPRIRGKKLTPTIWGDKETDAREMYDFLKSNNYVSDHKIYSILTPVYAIATFILTLTRFLVFPSDSPSQKFLDIAAMVSFVIAYTSIVRFSVVKRSQTYPYFLAKAYLELSEKAENSTIRLLGFLNGIDSYNAFLQRNFKIKITDPQSFYSRLATEPLNEQHETMKKIGQSFQQAGQDIDELAPLREIKKSMEAVYEKDLLTAARANKNVEDWLKLIGLVIPFVVTLLGLLTR
jgi:hypothetical protein